MADLLPFPRLCGASAVTFRDPQIVADAAFVLGSPFGHGRCANGMPGHPPCRSPAELEAMLRAQADTTTARESV